MAWLIDSTIRQGKVDAITLKEIHSRLSLMTAQSTTANKPSKKGSNQELQQHSMPSKRISVISKVPRQLNEGHRKLAYAISSSF